MCTHRRQGYFAILFAVGWVDSLWTRGSGMPPRDIQTTTAVMNITRSFIIQPENHVILPTPQIKCQPAVKILSMNLGPFTWRTPSHGVGNSSDTFAEICSVDAFVLVPPNNVLISLVYSYTYFVVVRYANFPPAESNKHVCIIIYYICDFTTNEKLAKIMFSLPIPHINQMFAHMSYTEIRSKASQMFPLPIRTECTNTMNLFASAPGWFSIILILYCGQLSIALQLTEWSNEECILVWFCWKMWSELLTFTQKWQYNIISIQNYINICELMVTVTQLNVK